MLAGECQPGISSCAISTKIASEVPLCKCLLRGGDLAKRLGRSKKRPDLATVDVADQVRECRTVPCGRANQREILSIHVPHVEIGNRPGDGT